MRVQMGWLWVLLCQMATCFFIGPGTNIQHFDANNTVAISLAQKLFIDMPNKIYLRSLKPLVKVIVDMKINGANTLDIGRTTFNQSNIAESRDDSGYTYELKYCVPFELEPNAFFNLKITYFYCLSKICPTEDQLIAKSIDRHARIVSKFVVIMGETDKPLYRPGDKVRFRFIALTSRNIAPQSEPLTWPKYRVIGDYGKKQLEMISPAERERMMKAPYFDSIEVRDPLGNVVRQWRDITPVNALNLTYKLVSDAKEGEWQIEARVKKESETVKLNVRHYILPRFQAHLKLPQSIRPMDTEVKFSVCAAYTNGPAMPGTFDAQVCVCNQHILESQRLAKKLLPKNQCTSNRPMTTRICSRYNGVLDGVECANVSANISRLMQGKSPGWMDKLGIFVEVAEKGTASSIVISGITDLTRWPEPKLELKMLPSFKHGLPVVGQVVYKNGEASSEVGMKLEIIVREINDPCNEWRMSRANHPTKLTRIISIKSEVETYDFVLPPLNFTKTALVSVRQVNKTGSKIDSETAELDDYYFGPWWLPRPRLRWNLEASKRLQLWDGSTGFAIQITVPNNDKISCPKSVQLHVLSNKALPPDTILTLQFVSRGQLITRRVKLEADYACVPRDDDYGHYECDSDGSIRCIEGWTGANCLVPLCGDNGCAIGGECVAPGMCTCKPGWTGEACETCIPRSGCLHGVCVKGGDCVCKPGFIGYLCNEAPVVFEDLDKEEKEDDAIGNVEARSTSRSDTTLSLRTAFKHTATVQLNGDFGPQFRAVAYVVKDGQMASDFVQINNLQSCATPAMAETSEIGGGLHFDKNLAAPGERVNISLKVSTGIDNFSEATSNICLLSVADVSTRNFDTADTRRIDFDAYMDMLRGYERSYISPNVDSTESAYRAAGIDFTIFTPEIEQIRPIFVCQYTSPRMAMNSPTVPDSAFESTPVKRLTLHNKPNLPPISKKPRLRDFFPEVWMFETARLTDSHLNKSLTVPDTLTTWEANAMCFTASRGLWLPIKQPRLTVRMPFFVEFVPPLMARRGEVLHLPISVFVYPESTLEGDSNGVASSTTQRICYEVEVSVIVDPKDWRAVGVSTFTACVCTGDLKETFRLPLLPKRIGNLNITVTAIARRGTAVCNDIHSGKELKVTTVGDAIRRSVRVIAEGVEKRITLGGMFCTTKEPSIWRRQSLQINLEDNEIVPGSLRSYVAVSGNVFGRALNNLDALVKMPTGCGEQNLVKVAPSVSVLRYLLESGEVNSNAVGDSHNDRLARKAAAYILDGFDNQLKYRHQTNGAFSTFGPQYGSKGNTWLTAYVFEVFSEAEMLPIASIAGKTLDAYPTLASAFDYLASQQNHSGDGCFKESGQSFLPRTQNSKNPEDRLQLTTHVLSALGFASTELKKRKGNNFTSSVRSAIKCIESTIEELPYSQWSTTLLAKFVYATKQFPLHVNPIQRAAIIDMLKHRSKVENTFDGSLKWWPGSTGSEASASPFVKVIDLQTTAYALLALGSNDDLHQKDRLDTMRWISRQQNGNGGFYSTQDTVLALRALTHNAPAFPSPAADTSVTVESSPISLVNVNTKLSKANQLVSHTYEIGTYNESDIYALQIGIKSAKPACILVHFTAIYNVPEPQTPQGAFDLAISSTQGGSSATVACTTALTTVCLRSLRRQPTGMLLVTLQLPSGWIVTRKELHKVALNENLQNLELNDEMQKVSAYFNGFATDAAKDGTDSMKCFTVPLHQRTFVQAARPSPVEAFDYYDNLNLAQSTLQLDSCQAYWEPSSGGVVSNASTTTNTTMSPIISSSPACPICETKADSMGLVDRLNRSLCLHENYLHIFKVYNSANRSAMPGLMYSFQYSNRLASWNTTARMLQTCECKIISDGKAFALFGHSIQPGALEVDLAYQRVILFDELVKVAARFERALALKAEGMKEGAQKYLCTSHKAFSILVKKLLSPSRGIP